MGEPLPVPPFEVVSIHDGRKLTVIDIDEDPLDVGVRCAYFKEGGWLMISDLMNNFNIINGGRQRLKRKARGSTSRPPPVH